MIEWLAVTIRESGRALLGYFVCSMFSDLPLEIALLGTRWPSLRNRSAISLPQTGGLDLEYHNPLLEKNTNNRL